MSQRLDTRDKVALHRFAEFFAELKTVFQERDEVLDQVALALLAREHVLMTGPPGTAKSRLSGAVVERILCEERGEPSLFQRQFTESTVQTDLVGPVDFKTLTETGRTEHFTDEGMLGAVHAFLDEVLDGRDMLLRSTLNVLEERELKQGTKVTRGQIECALMTTNRYMSEVLRESRETLLAFVDRIAFVSFVPRGFAHSGSMDAVLRRAVGQDGGDPSAELSIQDLDALQELVERVEVSEELLVRLRMLVEALEREQRLAERADPQFVATRYLSTRTVVRLGKLLRAITVFDLATRNPDRALRANDGDLAMLRLSLLLSGPAPADIAALAERESDPRERRQLMVMQREHEIFHDCLAKLPPHPTETTAAAPLEEPKPDGDEGDTTATESDGKAGDDAHELAAEAARAAPSPDAQALRSALTPPDSGGGDPLDAAVAMMDRADKATAAGSADVAQWIRRHALRELARSARFSALAGPSTTNATADDSGPTSVHAVAALSAQRLDAWDRALALREELMTHLHPEREAASARSDWRRGVAALHRELAALWDTALRIRVQDALASRGGDDLTVVLKAVEGLRVQLDATHERLLRVDRCLAQGAAPPPRQPFAITVAGPRLRPIVEGAYALMTVVDRRELAPEVLRFASRLAALGLGDAVPAADHLQWACDALERAETRSTEERLERERERPEATAPVTDLASYRALRDEYTRSSASAVVAELGLSLAGFEAGRRGVALAPTEVSEMLTRQSGSASQALADADLDRVERTMVGLETWWELSRDDDPDVRAVVHEERALHRLALECQLIAFAFPSESERAVALGERVATLYDRIREASSDAQARAAHEAWASLLSVPADRRGTA